MTCETQASLRIVSGQRKRMCIRKHLLCTQKDMHTNTHAYVDGHKPKLDCPFSR